jgi:hypothetical protein
MSGQESIGQDNNANQVADQQQQNNKNAYKLPQITDTTTLSDLLKIKEEYIKYLTEAGISVFNLNKETMKNLETMNQFIENKNKENIQFSEALKSTNIELPKELHQAIEHPMPPSSEADGHFNNFIASTKVLLRERERLIEDQKKELSTLKKELSEKNRYNLGDFNTTNEKKRPRDEGYHSIFFETNKSSKNDEFSTPSKSKNNDIDNDETISITHTNKKPDRYHTQQSFIAQFIPRNSYQVDKEQFKKFIDPIIKGNVVSNKSYEVKLDVK